MTPADFYKRVAEQLAKELTGEECTVELVEMSLLPLRASTGHQHIDRKSLAKNGPDPEGAARFALLSPTTTTPTPSKSQTPPERQ